MKKILLNLSPILFIFMLFSGTTHANINMYDTLEDLKLQDPDCAVATDGINTFFGEDFNASTMAGYPENFKPKWECMQTKKEADQEKIRQDFIDSLDGNCKAITDGVNTFFGEGFNASTMVAYPENFEPKWSCVEEESVELTKDEFLTTIDDSCKVITDGINQFWGNDFEISTKVGYPKDFIPKWECIEGTLDFTDNDKKLFDTLNKELDNKTKYKLDKGAEKISNIINQNQNNKDHLLNIVKDKLDDKKDKVVQNSEGDNLNWFERFKVDVFNYLYLKIKLLVS